MSRSAFSAEGAEDRRRTDTRARMVRAAVECYRERGMNGTGFSDVLAATGAARGAIYHHFPGGKEELAAAVIAANGTDVVAFFDRLFDRSPPGTALREFIAWYVQRLEATEMRFGCPMAPTVLDAALTSDVIADAAVAAFDGWETVIAAALSRRGVDRRRAGTLAQTVVAAIEGALMLSRAHRSPAPLQSVGEELAQLIEEVSEKSDGAGG